MAFAQARYGFWLRSMPVEMAGKFSATITAEAWVVFAAWLYLGLETKVSWPGAACSMPATPVIWVSGSAFSRRAFRALAMSDSFISGVSENCSGMLALGCGGVLFCAWGRAALGRRARTPVAPLTCLLLEERDLPGIGLAASAAAVG